MQLRDPGPAPGPTPPPAVGPAPPATLPAGVERVFVLGDLHGFLDEADELLRTRCGADADWVLPAGTAVVQVGDVLHKGPRSAELLSRVDGAMAANDGRWVQLWGNHEAASLQGRPRAWGRSADEPDEVLEVLHRWWETRAAGVAVAFHSAELGEVLVTHAGLSPGWWDRLGCPTDAAAAARALNAPVGHDARAAFGSGRLRHGRVDPAAGPAWCDTAAEGWGAWARRGSVPFSQVHGHAAPWSWRHGRWMPHADDRLRDAVRLDHAAHRAWLDLPGGRLASVDTAPHRRTGLVGDPVAVLGVVAPPVPDGLGLCSATSAA